MAKYELAGFDQPQYPKNKLIAELYQKHNLGMAPSLADIEPIAVFLLESPLTMMEGMSLVLGRDVRSEERGLIRDILFAGGGKNRFASLLIEKAVATIAEE